MTIRMALASLAGALALAALPCPAGEPAKTPKEERIAKVKADLAEEEKRIASGKHSIEILTRDGKAERAARYHTQVEKASRRAETLRLELRWLTGELTRDSAETAVKTAEEALNKAPDAEKPAKQEALDAAKKELAAVVALENAGDF